MFRYLRSKQHLLVFVGAFLLVGAPLGYFLSTLFTKEPPLPSFTQQACSLPEAWLERTKRGYLEGRAGEISILPRQPAYFSSGAGGWTHSGPWPYLQRVPLVFYGPGIIPKTGQVETPATLADIAPTIATMLRGSVATEDGRSLDEVIELDAKLLNKPSPKLILTIVWDGGGWNVLEQWPGDWDNLLSMMEGGVSFLNATVGSSPSVTPSVHTTLGTGVFPATHGITDIPVRDPDTGDLVDSFRGGRSSAFIKTPTIAERWDEQTGNRAKVGMIGYEPWHLGMIGQGAERPGGDKDDAVWLDTETNEWKSNPASYTLPVAVAETSGLDEDLARLDAADGKVDQAWGDEAILDQQDRWEETPAFIEFHTRAMKDLIREEGYGKDEVTDLLFTNYKQIDRVGHYFNMASPEVNQSLLVTDEVLGETLEFLDEEVGRGKYVVVLTADHGQQPNAPDIDGYGVDPGELKRDIESAFGRVVDQVRPTEIFLDVAALEATGKTVEDVARFVGDYRLTENNTDGEDPGMFGPSSRVIELAIPSKMLESLDCSKSPGSPAAPSSG
ncbi:MAG: alkaline phosphatase family protein [Actinomycetota bacterium]